MDSTAPHQPISPASSTPMADQPLFPSPLSATADVGRRASSSEDSGRVLELELQSHVASLLPSTSNSSTALWKAHIDKLSKPEQQMFLMHGGGDLAECVKRLELTCTEQGEKSRVAKIAKLFRPLFDTMNMYAPIAQTMIQADPTSSALVLGGITCVMSISSRFLDYQKKIANALAEMGEKLQILLEYGSDIYVNNDKVQNSIVEVFGDILQFCSEAWNMFRHEDGEPRSSFKTFTTSLGKSFEMKFGDILSKFDRDLAVFHGRALLCDRKETKEFRGRQLQYMDHQLGENQKNFSAIRSMGQGIIETVSRIQLEEGQNRMQRQIKGAQAEQEREYVERDDKRQRVLAWLPSIAFHGVQEDKSQKLLKGTGQWLLDNDDFQLWKTNPHSELLWVFGKRGCGKSYLASLVIEEFSKACEASNSDDQDGQTISALAYIYCNSRESTKVDPSKLLGSILKQLSHQLPRPEIETWLEQLYNRRSEIRPPDQTEIKDAIVAILGRFTRTFLVVDGLDECHELGDDQFDELCQFVRSLTLPQAEKSVVKVVAFSRPDCAEIKSAFSGCPIIEIDAGLNYNDIKDFIAMKLSGNGFHLKKKPELLTEVERSLLSGADGMFLWVDLVVNALKGQRTARDIRATMREIPRDLDAVYENSIKKILGKEEKVRKLMLRTLLWITNAKRPLRRDELLEALVIEPGMKELEQDDRILGDDGEADDNFAKDCEHLIILDNNGYYQLLHSSLKDYLCSPPTAKFNVPTEYRVMQTIAEKTLGETCLIYLTFDKFKTGPAKSYEEASKLLDENPFLDYAANYWGQHVSAANEVEVNGLVNNFLYSSGARDLSIQLFLMRHDPPFSECHGASTPLHVSSIFNLLEIAKSIPEVQSMRNQRDGYRCLPLDYAVQYQGRQICNWLLEKPDNFIPENYPAGLFPAIHGAVLNDWREVVETLIAWKYDPESTHGDRQATPLHFAARKGSESAFEALIKAKVAINIRDIHDITPLIDAAAANHTKLAMRLLEEGAEVNLQEINGFTALHWAAWNGNTSLAKVLLQKGADKESAAEKLGLPTPIYLAADQNHHEVLELLVAKRVDIEGKGPNGYNALLISCARGSLKCVMSLLQAGAEIVTYTNSKRTAFHVAAGNGHLDVLKALYKKLPKQWRDLINSVDTRGDTALHDAVANGHKAEAKFLLEKGVLVNKSNKLGQSPLQYAALYGQADFISLLLEAGADPEQRDNYSWTLLHIATGCNELGFVQKLLGVIPTLHLGARLETGETSLFIAAGRGLLEFLKFFLERNEDAAVTNRHDYTPLHAAAQSGNPMIVKKLLGAGCDGFSRSKYGTTPFLLAVLSKKVEVVDVFLKEGFNGCNIPDNTGFTCFHAIASSGSLKMLEKLKPFLDLASIQQADYFGNDAMIHAAEGGNAEMIDQLISLGIPVEGLKLAHKRPIHQAVLGGHHDFVRRQIELGAHVNERIGRSNMSPLHLATSGRMPLIADMLLKAGADPAERDAFGLSCLDYAVRDPKVWEKMGRWKNTYQTIGLKSRMPILEKTVQRTIQMILALPENPAPKDDAERTDDLVVLVRTLLAIGTASDTDAARMCCIELASPSEFAIRAAEWICGICATEKKREKGLEKWYFCRQCYNQDLCASCYLDYLEGVGKPKSAPKSSRVLQELENEMKPIREILKDSTILGSGFLNAACDWVKVNAAWLDEKAKEYDEWEKSYNDSGRFDNYHRPGQKLLKLIKKARKAKARENEERERKKKGKWKGYANKREGKKTSEKGDEADVNDSFAAITEELSDLYAEHRPDKEIPDFICSGHEYLEVPNESAISETDTECFGADGKLTNEWLSKLFEKYQDQMNDRDADMQTSKSKEGPNEPETNSEKENLGPAQDGEGEGGQHTHVADQKILGLTALLMEPTETSNAVGDTQRKTSDHDFKVQVDSSNADLIDVEMSEKRIKLEAIKRVLKDNVSDMMAIIWVKRLVENGAMQDEEHNISDENSQSISPTQSDKKQDTELDDQAALLENTKEPTTRNKRQEETAGLNDIDVSIFQWVISAIEVAWRLAQVTIVGCVQQALVRESLRDFLEGYSEVDQAEFALRLLKGLPADESCIDFLEALLYDLLKSNSPDAVKELLIDMLLPESLY